jgi:hypothetical protein
MFLMLSPKGLYIFGNVGAAPLFYQDFRLPANNGVRHKLYTFEPD